MSNPTLVGSMARGHRARNLPPPPMNAARPSALTAHATLADFARRTVACEDVAHAVHVAGRGPAVIVLHEMPGLGAHVLRFARWVRDAGFTVWLPSLFGADLAEPDAAAGAAVFRATCVSAEFRALGAGDERPVTRWLRALARLAHAECGGPGVGAVGMCSTGNLALSMVLEPATLAPVLCQPSLPLDDPGAIDLADDALRAVRARLERDDLTVLAYRFAGDRVCRAERFAAYRQALGARFVARELPDDAARLDGAPPFHATHVPYPHSVVTVHLVDRAGSPTRTAVDEIIAFLRARLHDAVGAVAPPPASLAP